MHFGVDENTQRYKFYINFYHTLFHDAENAIRLIYTLLGIPVAYFYETDIIQIDSIWFDITHDGSIQIKVYEIVKSIPNEYIPYIPPVAMIKEFWCMKSTAGRKKYFVRFATQFPEMTLFVWDYPVDVLTDIEQKYQVHLKRRVKYLCFEKDKREIYFI